MSRIEYASPEGQVVNGCTVCEQMPNNYIQGGFTIPIVDSRCKATLLSLYRFTCGNHTTVHGSRKIIILCELVLVVKFTGRLN